MVFYTVKITDFGLSKAIGAGFSEARSTVGTRPYTAPEVLREDSHDFSSDLWCRSAAPNRAIYGCYIGYTDILVILYLYCI